MRYIAAVSEFNFLTQIVIMMYEDPSKEVTSDERFHIELHFSPGMVIRGLDNNSTTDTNSIIPNPAPAILVQKEKDKVN